MIKQKLKKLEKIEKEIKSKIISGVFNPDEMKKLIRQKEKLKEEICKTDM